MTSEELHVQWLMAVSMKKMNNLSRKYSLKTSWNITQETRPHSPSSFTQLGSVTAPTVLTDFLSSSTQFWLYLMYTLSPAKNWFNGQDSPSHLSQFTLLKPSIVISQTVQHHVVGESLSVLWNSVVTRGNGLLANVHAQKFIHGLITSKVRAKPNLKTIHSKVSPKLKYESWNVIIETMNQCLKYFNWLTDCMNSETHFIECIASYDETCSKMKWRL